MYVTYSKIRNVKENIVTGLFSKAPHPFHLQEQVWLKPEDFKILNWQTEPTKGVTFAMKALDENMKYVQLSISDET